MTSPIDRFGLIDFIGAVILCGAFYFYYVSEE